MHKIDSEGHVSGQFSEGNVSGPTPAPATVISTAWLNDVQNELTSTIEGLGGTLLKGANQLLARLNARFGRLDLANTWSGNQSFGGAVTVAELATLNAGAAIPPEESYSFTTPRTGYLMVPAFMFAPDAPVPTTGAGLFEFDNEDWLRAGTSISVLRTTFRLPEGATITKITMLSAAGYLEPQSIIWGVRKITKGNIGQYISRADVLAAGNITRTHPAIVTGARTASFQQITGTDLASGDPVIAPKNGYFFAFVSMPAAPNANDGVLFGGLHIEYQISNLLPAT